MDQVTAERLFFPSSRLRKTAALSMSPLSSTHTTTSRLKQKILPILQTNINSYSEGQSCSVVIIKAIHSLFTTLMAYTPELSFLYLFFKDLFRFYFSIANGL